MRIPFALLPLRFALFAITCFIRIITELSISIIRDYYTLFRRKIRFR